MVIFHYQNFINCHLVTLFRWWKIHPSIFRMLKELQLAELETMSPWQVKLCPLRRNWLELEDWPWFLLDEQGWKEGLLSFFLFIDVHRFVSKRLGLMRFVLFLKNSFDSWMWGASFFQVILKTLRWVRQIQPETFHTSISRRVATRFFSTRVFFCREELS